MCMHTNTHLHTNIFMGFPRWLYIKMYLRAKGEVELDHIYGCSSSSLGMLSGYPNSLELPPPKT